MFLYCAQWLSGYFHWHWLYVFNYLTFRSILASLTALLITLFSGNYVITYLKKLKFGQAVREDGPHSHYSKAGTPTLGGLLILLSVIGSTLLWGNLFNHYVWILIFVFVGFGWIGYIDDYRKITKKSAYQGLSVRKKYFWQSIIALVTAFILYKVSSVPEQTDLVIPFFKNLSIHLGGGFLILAYFVIVGSSNAVNLTDGLDGLAIMPVVLIASGLGVFVYVSGNIDFAHYLYLPYLPDIGELIVIISTLVGAGLGFLWFNTYPAQVFMGDVGALALGAALGTLAILVRQEIVFFIMSGVFVVETLSVMLQVVYFKWTKKRIFKMAPLHHHFELKGWPEPRVVVRFWIITFILVLISLTSLKLR